MTSALGLGADVPAPRPIAPGLFNAIPEAPPLTAPVIPNAGAPAGFSVPAPIGAVVVSYGLAPRDKTSSDAVRYYAVLPGRPAAHLAGAGRDPAQHQFLWPATTAAAGRRRGRQTAGVADAGHRTLPRPAGRASSTRPTIPVTCAFWSKPAGAATSTLSLLSGSALPVPEGVRTLDLVGVGQRRDPRRVGARHRLLRPERRRRRVRACRRIAVLGLRHRRALRHRHRSRTVATGKPLRPLA